MNATQLLAHFDRLAEAPDAVPRLRRFILDLAVRGKLVEQDAGDEPAAKLLKRIQAEKARLVETGSVKASKPQPATATEAVDSSLIPGSWRWTRLVEVGFISPRNTAPDDQLVSFVPMPMIAADYGTPNQHEVRPWREIKTGYTHFAEGDVGLAKITPCFENGKSTVFRGLTNGIGAGTTELHIVRPVLVSADYILIYLKSSLYIAKGIPRMTGTAGQKRVPTEYFTQTPFPLPPLAEQHRIIAKVDELMALCDQLEAAQQERERRRDCLASASLQRLNQPAADTTPQAQRDHARFHLNHLPRLITRPKHIKAMRQTILNLAVRGKLLEQDANDESATKLLKRIQAEKARLAKLGCIKVEKTAEPIDQAVGPTPSGWALCRWNSIAMKIGDIDHKMPDTVAGGVPYVSPRDFYPNNVIDFEGAKRISRADYLRLAAKIKPDIDDLIYPRYGTIGENRLVAEQREFLASYSCAVVKTLTGFVDPKYQYIFSISGYCKDQAKAAENKTTQANVGIASIQQYIVPLPPLAEQHRIVAKVDELMALCDQLETQLTTTQTDSRRLLEAVLGQGHQQQSVAR